MKYLVLHTFRSFGRTLRKGEVVDESAIRSLRLRLSEHKVVPAVEAGPDESAVISSGEAVQQGVAAPVAQSDPPKEAVVEEKSAAPKKEEFVPVRLSFGK